MKSSKFKSLKDEVFKIEVFKIKVFKNWSLQKLKTSKIEVFSNWSLQKFKSSKFKVFKNWRLNNWKLEVFKNWSLEKINSWKSKSSKIVVSKIEVFKMRPLKLKHSNQDKQLCIWRKLSTKPGQLHWRYKWAGPRFAIGLNCTWIG